MAAIVYQTNKKTGITYAYESVSFWDKEKKQSRAKRKCIGRLDPKTQKIIPTRKKDNRKQRNGPSGARHQLLKQAATSSGRPISLTELVKKQG